MQNDNIANSLTGTVEGYGKDVLNMSKRRIYEYIQATAIYRNVRNSAQIAPMNIEQALVLKTLPPDLQQTAWNAAVEEHLAEKVPLTVKLVEKHISTVKSNEGLDTIEEHMFADHIFIGIPKRLEIPMRKTFGRSRQHLIKSITLPRIMQQQPASPLPPASRPLVLVSPDFDLLEGHIALTDLQHLITACGVATTYRFLLWSAQPAMFKEIISWPENIEIAIRIWGMTEVDRCAEYMAAIPNARAIWTTPVEPLALDAILPLTRMLIGAPDGTPGYQNIDPSACRQVLGEAVFRRPPVMVHIAMPLLKQLAQEPATTAPDILAIVVES